MKKKLFHALCTVLAIILILMSAGCGIGKKESDFTVEHFDNTQRIDGTITEINNEDTLTLALNQNYQKEYGEVVYVRTANVERFCVNDEIYVKFDTIERPKDENEPITVISAGIGPHETDMWAKPVIYLYPEVPTECSVTLELSGELTCTYPDYDENGWQGFTAYPDGTLVFPDGKEYYCLFWEGETYTDFELSEGFCVRGEDTEKFLEYALSALGLTPREANEFIIYWLPIMQNNEYNVITFQTDRYTDAAKLEITPTPDSILRVFMTFKASDAYVELPPQTFEGFTREGFTVVEWGGTELK